MTITCVRCEHSFEPSDYSEGQHILCPNCNQWTYNNLSKLIPKAKPKPELAPSATQTAMNIENSMKKLSEMYSKVKMESIATDPNVLKGIFETIGIFSEFNDETKENKDK